MSSNSVTTPLPEATGNVGLGYGIAIAVGILVLVSSIMLASYTCVRFKGRQLDSAAADLDERATRAGENSTIDLTFSDLDEPTIRSYPMLVYGRNGGGSGGPEIAVCSICLAEYSPEEVLRRMPECKHWFHATCIDEWLRISATCPMCRNSPVPTPVPTPLSELIPLASHAR